MVSTTDGRALVIKGPGKVFAGSFASTARVLYTIAYAANTYTITPINTIASIISPRACGDEDTTNNFAYVTSDNPNTKDTRISMVTGADGVKVSVPAVIDCSAGPGVNYLMMTGNSI